MHSEQPSLTLPSPWSRAGPPRVLRSRTPPPPRLILPSPIRAAAPAAGGCDLSALISSGKTTLSLLRKDLLVLHSFGLLNKAALAQLLGLDQGEGRRRIRDRITSYRAHDHWAEAREAQKSSSWVLIKHSGTVISL